MAVGKIGIKQIVEVVELAKIKVNQGKSITEARIEATHEVSKARGVEFTSIEDKYIRGLDNIINGSVGVKGADEFDDILKDAIYKGDIALRNILLSRTTDLNLRKIISSVI